MLFLFKAFSYFFLLVVAATEKFPAVKSNDNCDYWAKTDGECVNNPNYMWSQCHGSCMEIASDVESNCEKWAEEGECTANPVFVSIRCPEACSRAVGWSPWMRRAVGITDSLPFDEKYLEFLDKCKIPNDIFSAAEMMKLRLNTYLQGGMNMAIGLGSASPSEYLGMMGLAEGFLYTIRLYESSLDVLSPLHQSEIDEVRQGIKEKLDIVMEFVGSGYSSDLLMRALPKWVPFLEYSSDSVANVLGKIHGKTRAQVLSESSNPCETSFGPVIGSSTTNQPNLTSQEFEFSPVVKLRNGVEMPLMGLGTWQIEGADCEIAVEEAIKIGYRHFDTAEAYNNEAAVGWGIRHAIDNGLVRREELFIASKVSDEGNAGYDEVRRLIANQMELLQTDYLDLYMLHSPISDSQLQAETWEALEDLLEEKKLRAIGVSNFNLQELKNLMEHSRVKPMVLQNKVDVYHVGKQLDNEGDEVVAFAQEHGVVVVAYSSFSGYPFSMKPVDDPIVRFVAANHKPEPATTGQVILRWLLQRGIAVIPRSTNGQRLEENYGALTLTPLSAAEMTILDSIQNLVESAVSVAVDLKKISAKRSADEL